MHEKKFHKESCFATLTYRTEELVWGAQAPTLYPKHLQNFMKRLRKARGAGIKFFGCGEYGDDKHRPHYHLCLFGVDFNDKKPISQKNGNWDYSSRELDDIWTHGRCHLGELTLQSASYVARYTLKKAFGNETTYSKEQNIEAEFIRMSRGGRKGRGIGFQWFEKYKSDVFPHDYIELSHQNKIKPPRYYTELLKPKDAGYYWVYTKKELDNLNTLNYIKGIRKSEQFKNLDDMTLSRLKDKETVKRAQIQQLRRD